MEVAPYVECLGNHSFPSLGLRDNNVKCNWKVVVVLVVVVDFILSRLLYLAFSVNLGLLCTQHQGRESLG